MPQISVSDLIATGVAVSPSEAVALTLAVADVLAERGITSLPSDEQIVLSSTGHVSFENVTVPTSEDTGEEPPDVTAQLAALVRRLLRFDEPAAGDRRRRVPGGVLVLLARSLRQIDLPPLELSAFREALARFGEPNAALLAGMFWRAARMRAPHPRRQPLELLPGRAELHDRRRHVPPPSELRRYLRDVERELYETRVSVASAQPPRPAATPSAPPVAPSAGIRRRVAPRRIWQVSSGVAATAVGAVLGTFAAFILSGSLDVGSKPEPSRASVPIATMGTTPAVPAAVSPAAVQPKPRPERTIQTTRTVQPLLLAAAVGAEVFSPSFTPRGRSILFHAGRKASPLMRASVTDAGEVQSVEKLIDDGAANYHVTMSPDGEFIAYDSDRDGVRGVYVAHADGSNPRRISGSGYASVPSWSPDGGRVAFVRAEPNKPRVWNVWIADVYSGRLERITEHRVGQPWGASWFPDGRQIAYSVEDRLMVADLDSGMARGYRSPRAGRLVRTPAVSPNGRQIVFQVQHDGVWLLDVERARMRRILTDATAEEFVWSPEGDAIAYHARSGGSYGLWRLALHNGGAN